jgi:rod shape-determining protein MreC
MRNLLNFLSKHVQFITFLVLEGLALYMLSSRNNYHNSRIVKGTRGITIGIEKRISNVKSFFRLREMNQFLVSENNMLKNRIEKLTKKQDLLFVNIIDTLYSQQYIYTSARVIENSVVRQKNFFTLDKGKRHGLSTDMAVISGNSAAGVIVGCSDNYSLAMSMLNLDFRLSGRIKSNGYFGSLKWNGSDPGYMILSDVPQHVTFGIGDTIETTGYSAIFPEGILIGTVSNLEKSGGDFYRITVALSTDFRKLQYVNVIGNLKKKEKMELEKSFQ